MNRHYIIKKKNDNIYAQCAETPARKKWWKLFLLLTTAIVVAMVFIPTIKKLLSALLVGLMPVYIAIFVIYLLKEPQKWLANKAFKSMFKRAKNPKHCRMNLALIVVFILFLALLVGIFFLFVPKFLSIIEDIVKNADAYATKIKTELTAFLSQIPYLEKIDVDNYINENIDQFVDYLKGFAPKLAGVLAGFASSVLNFVGILIVSLFFSFLFLLNIDKYKKNIKKFTKQRVSPQKFRKLQNFVVDSDRILVDYGFSKLIEGIIIFVTVCFGLVICGAPMPIELSLFMAIFNIIPYVGPIIALVPIILFSLVLASANVALISAIVSVSIVIIVTGFITPLIVGHKIKVDTLTVILSLIIGGALFGAIGLILAPPVSAIILKCSSYSSPRTTQAPARDAHKNKAVTITNRPN